MCLHEDMTTTLFLFSLLTTSVVGHSPSPFNLTTKHDTDNELQVIIGTNGIITTNGFPVQTIELIDDTNHLKFPQSALHVKHDTIVRLDTHHWKWCHPILLKLTLEGGEFYYHTIPSRCRHCYSEPVATHYDPPSPVTSRYLIARHGETRTNCGGRTCRCYDGRLTCDDYQCHHRREYSMLGTDPKGYDEKQLLVDAFHYINRPASGTGREPVGTYFGTANPWTYHQTVLDHSTYSGIAHGGPEFLPWHRQYLWELEQKLQVFHKCVTLPYWDWTMDPSADAAHVMDNYFGGDADTDAESNACSFKPGNPTQGWTLPGPLFTRSGSSTSALPSVANVANILSQTSFSSFASMNEGTHGSPHVRVGGLMGSISWSPSDPFFWMHHAMVDKIWWDWQRADWPNRWNQFTGSATAQVSPQWSGRTNADTFDSEGSLKVCYDDVIENEWVLVEWLRLNRPLIFNGWIDTSAFQWSSTDIWNDGNDTKANIDRKITELNNKKVDGDRVLPPLNEFEFPNKWEHAINRKVERGDKFPTILAALSHAQQDPQLMLKLEDIGASVHALQNKFPEDVQVKQCRGTFRKM